MNADLIAVGLLGAIIGIGLTPIIKKYYIQPVFIQKKEEAKGKIVTSPPLLGIHDEGRRLGKIHSLGSDSWSGWILFNERSESTASEGRTEGRNKGRDYRHNYTII